MNTKNTVGVGMRHALYYRWASGRIERLEGTCIENNEDRSDGFVLRYHDWNRGVTVEKRFHDSEIANLIPLYS